jgi:RNA polymerase sigma-70 factor (ECF subfamily)
MADNEPQSFPALVAGDEQAWTALAEQFRQQLRQLTVRYVGEGEADDLLQEVFVRVYTHREELRDPAHLDHFVRQVWNQRVVDHWRHRRVRDKVMVPPERAEPASYQPTHTDPAKDALRAELLGEIDRSGLLSAEQKLLLKLHLFDGLSLAAVARVLQRNAATTETWYYRAQELLRLQVALNAYRERPGDFRGHFSDQQRAALGLLTRGLSLKKIARELGMKVPQVQELLAPVLRTLCQVATAEWRHFLSAF